MKIKNVKRYRIVISMASAILLLFLVFAYNCSNQKQAGTFEPQISTSLMQVNEDGTMTEVEGIKIEGDLLASEIAALEAEIDSLLQELDYIEDSEVTLFYRSENTGTLCFQACLLGENLEEHVGEISGMIEEKLGSCDLEHSSIVDIVGTIYPVQ